MPVYLSDANKPSGVKAAEPYVTQPFGVMAFECFLWVNLMFGAVQIAGWVEQMAKGRNAFVTGYYDALSAEVVSGSVGWLLTAQIIIFIRARRPVAVAAAMSLLVFRVLTALIVTSYAENALGQTLSVAEQWYPSAAATAFWIPCLHWSREHWALWTAIPDRVEQRTKPRKQVREARSFSPVTTRPDSVPGDTPGVNVARHDRFRLLATGPKPNVPCIGETPDTRDICIEIATADDVVDAALAEEPPTVSSRSPLVSWQVVTLLSVAMMCGTAFAIAWCCFRR